ncbi:MAG: RNA polymerase sigma factor [Planctomycetota bacterium]
MAEQIAVAMAALSNRYRAVLRAKYEQQLSVAEIAARWRESTKAIESLLTRARAAFRTVYKELGG